MSLNVTGDDFNAPTNPQLVSLSTDFSDGDRIYTAIVTHGEVSLSISGWGGSVSENSNLSTTKGFRLKCYDALTTTGIRFNPTDQNLIDNDYFVLLHSDKPFEHHFAKVTEVLTEDEYGDAFEFEPKLGNEIPKDTKFIIFEVTKNTNAVALSLGLLQDSTPSDLIDQLGRRMSVARPLFYFYDGLDKKGELNHNVKYYAMREFGTGATFTLDNNDDCKTFVTVQDFGKTIIDYSKFSHSVRLTDELRTLDETNTATNEGSTGLSSNTTDYNTTYRNARRISDDIKNTPIYTGPIRYIHYNFSPMKANVAYNVYEHNSTESIGGKGGFAETSIIDSSRIMPKKIKEFDEYRVRQDIHRGILGDFYSLNVTYQSSGNNYTYEVDTDYDLHDFLNDGDEIRFGEDIFIVDDIQTLVGRAQSIVLKRDTGTAYAFQRTETESEFTAKNPTGNTPTVGTVLERRAFSSNNNTLMVSTELLNNRFSRMYVALSSLNHNGRFASVTACNASAGMITLSFEDDSYSGTPLGYADGNYVIYIERFNGEIENIESKKEDGQTIMSIQGRDRFNKLLSPIVNLNTLFSEDIIYSSNSPYNKLSQIDSTTLSIALGDTTKETGIAVSDFDIVPTQGDKIFTVNGYIGKILTATGDPLTITFTPALTEANSEIIYIDTEKNYVLSKALSSSHLATNKPSSLTGAANKGLIFTAGNKINSDGSEGDSLVGTSSNENEGAIGYAINSPSSISKDFAFQSKLHDEKGKDISVTPIEYSDPASFDVVNTLIDFEVVSTSKKDNITQIELAPYIPVTLGRKIENNEESSEYTFTSIGPVTTSLMAANGAFKTANTNAYSLNMGDSIFVGESKVYAGNVLHINIQTTSTVEVVVFLDRNLVTISASDEIYVATKPISHIAVVNGSHLWGGKILTVPHLTYVTDGLVPLNIENTTSTKDYNSKYGQLYYKGVSLSFGSFGLNQPSTKVGSSTFPKFYDNPTKLNYLMTAYNFKPNVSSNNVINLGQTDSYRTLPVDMRAITSVFGSNASISRIHRTEYNNLPLADSLNSSVFTAIGKLQRMDPSAARLFLYITSDLLPYSSLRSDSIMNGSKVLNNYNLLLMENKKISDSNVGEGRRIALKNSNFQSYTFSSETSLSTLKRFSMMRLTEICFDSFFNQVNPEKPITKKYGTNISSTFNSYEITSLGAISISGTSLTLNAGSPPSLSVGDNIVDTFGNFIGTIGTASGGNVYSFSSQAYKTNNGSYATSGLKAAASSENHSIRGRNDKDSLFQLDADSLHPLKGAISPELANLGVGSTDKIYIENGGAVTSTGQEAYLSYGLKAGSSNSPNVIFNDDNFPFKPIFEQIKYSATFQGMIGVILDRYDIEQAGAHKLVSGNTTQVLKRGTSQEVDSLYLFSLGSSHHFKEFANVGDASTTAYVTTYPKTADGASIVFKPRLRVETADLSTTTIASSNGNLKRNEIDITPSAPASEAAGFDNAFLQFVDLTGCYLVSEAGSNIDGGAVTSGTKYQRKSMTDAIPTELIYIYSHEVSDTDANKHHLVTDSSLVASRAYRILQPNETCFYNFMPNKIFMNTLRPEYTKVSNENKVYNINSNYFFREGEDRSSDNTTLDEGVLSMFVPIDTDDQNSESRMVIAGPDAFFDSVLPEGKYNLYFTDGENGEKVSVEVTKNANNNQHMVLSKMVELNGVVSVSETFTVSSNQELKIDPTRACIGSTVSIGLEGEDLINELLEQEGIEFTQTSTSVPMYLAPNYQGVDLFSAIRYVLDRKNMKLVEENNVFKIAPNDEDEYYTNIIINDSGDYLIQDFEKVSTLFDFYNEVTVYGNAHKGRRKDIRSINKRGRKTLEVVDDSLLTQEEVDKRAQKLLRIHSTLNQKLSLTMSSQGITQLRVGDIVGVEIVRENIQLSEFIVLQMEHSITGFIKLELGRYSKDLSDIFSELLISSKQTKAALRNSGLQTNENSFNFLETMTTKELKLLVRKREASGGATLGFGTTLNTNTSELGFQGGETIVITNLLEEEL